MQSITDWKQTDHKIYIDRRLIVLNGQGGNLITTTPLFHREVKDNDSQIVIASLWFYIKMEKNKKMENEKEEIRYFSMFTGVGGFELGIKNTGTDSSFCGWEKDSRSPKSLQGNRSDTSIKEFKCVGFSETDKYCCELLKNKFPNIKNYGDATKIDPRELPDFDMLCGGFPCQAFSIAGKRRGFEDTRGTLFFEIARIVKAKKPKIILLENVKGLLNHEKGKTFTKIIQTLEELGYEIQWMVLNSKFFGVPQNRERVFIIGSLRGTSRPEILPFRETEHQIDGKHKKTRQIIQVDDVARENKHKFGDRLKEDGPTFTLNSIEQRGILEGGGWEKRHENIRRVYGTDGISPTIPTGQGGGVMTKIIEPEIKRLQADISGKGYNSQQDRVYFSDGVMCCLPNANPDNKLNIIIRGRPKMPYKEGERELDYSFYDDTCPTLSQNCASGDQKNIVFTKTKEVSPIYDEEGKRTPEAHRVYDTQGISPVMKQNGVAISNKSPREFKWQEENAPTLQARDYKDPKLVKQKTSIRRLTPTECERLQGFPDNWTEGFSDTQRYRMMGNAVTVNVIKSILENLK